MEFWSVFLVACALSADAFAVSLCKGFSLKKNRVKALCDCGGVFWWISGSYAIAWICAWIFS